ncbi:MAG: hypothetical protein ACI8UR_001909 [Natronomonas sp.]|jgi:hypothetical protein
MFHAERAWGVTEHSAIDGAAAAGDLSPAMTAAATIDPHLVVLLALLTFWGVYAALRIRDAIEAALRTGMP